MTEGKALNRGNNRKKKWNEGKGNEKKIKKNKEKGEKNTKKQSDKGR